ncbi:MAG: lipopolysaccharide transport periplasmic protein LptA [Burkholderiaceae bacterium]
MRTLLARCVTVLLVLAPLAVAHAERADREKPTQIVADRFDGDDLNQTVVYSGDVVLTRGTLRITGERMELREDPERYRYAVVTAAPGKLASFRQRRDATTPGVDEYVEGYAERIEYDERAETVKFIGRAQWRRLENGQPRDELAGSLIVYDSRNSKYWAEGAAGSAQGDGRVRTIIAPRDASPHAAPPANLKPAPVAPAPAR